MDMSEVNWHRKTSKETREEESELGELDHGLAGSSLPKFAKLTSQSSLNAQMDFTIVFLSSS
jgi:hypothetical protein